MEIAKFIYNYFKLNPNNYSTKLHNEINCKYKEDIMFQPRTPTKQEIAIDYYIPAETRYMNGSWVIRILPRFLCHKDKDRIISHELLHILLRYRYGLPFIDNTSNHTQSMILSEIDHRLINPILDKAYGIPNNKNKLREVVDMLKVINPYLNNVREGMDRERYIEIFRKCTDALGEKLPNFIILNKNYRKNKNE